MSDLALVATVSVPKSKGLHKSGAKKGRLRKGCRFAGKGIKCTPAVAASLDARKGKSKRGGGGRRGNANFRTPKSPQAAQNKMVFDALQSARRGYKTAGNCTIKTHFAMKIIKSLQYMSRLPSGKSDVNKRNHRYAVEARRVQAEVRNGCTSAGEVRRTAPTASSDQYQAWMATVPGARRNPMTGRFDGTRR